MNINIPRNIENQTQYNVFETMFMSERRKDIIEITKDMSKNTVISILDAYDEMIDKHNPEMISVRDCITLAVANGTIDIDTGNITHPYRELAASAIDSVETILFEILPEPDEDEEFAEHSDMSKIHGVLYYELEDSLTDLFKNYKL